MTGLTEPAHKDLFFSIKAESVVYIVKSLCTCSECVMTGTRTVGIIFMGLIFR